MNEWKAAGRTLTLFVLLALYVTGLFATIDYPSDHHEWKKYVGIVWITVNVAGLLAFMVWSWM